LAVRNTDTTESAAQALPSCASSRSMDPGQEVRSLVGNVGCRRLYRLGRGKNPNLKTIFASFNQGLGERTNNDLRRLMQSQRYLQIFGLTCIGQPGSQCNSSLIEYADYKGGFRNTTVQGQINGQALDLGVN